MSVGAARPGRSIGRRHVGVVGVYARVAASILLLLAACGRPPAPPEPEGAIDLVATVSQAAGELELRFDATQAQYAGSVPLASDVWVRSREVEPGTIRLAWVSTGDRDGPVLRLRFERSSPEWSDLVAASYRSDGTAIVGEAVRLATVENGAGTSPTPLGEAQLTPLAHVGTHLPDLRAEFADFPLGDMDRSGAIDVLDVLAILDVTAGAVVDDFRLYHSDLDGDGSTAIPDVLRLLDKAVDPDLPAEVVVKPSYVTFLQMMEGAPLLIGNAGNVPLGSIDVIAPAGVSTVLVAGVDGQSAAYRLDLPAENRAGWLPGTMRVEVGGQSPREIRVGNLVLLVAGQSNAAGRGQPESFGPGPIDTVRMLGNDYLWAEAEEPLDDPAGQVDGVSSDDSCFVKDCYSFGTVLGQTLWSATSRYTYLVPSALSATKTQEWLLGGGDPDDRDTLFGSSVFRANVSAALRDNPEVVGPEGSEGGPVSAVVWFQGESDANLAGDRASFVENTNEIMDRYDRELAAPVVYVQLAANSNADRNLEQAAVADMQRRMEAGSRDSASRERFYMVVANDLPLSDPIHLSSAGLAMLGERIALAIREHVLDEPIDGTGPRLVDVTYEGTTVWIRADRDLTKDVDETDYAGFFTVFDGPPSGSVDDAATYGLNDIDVTDAYRDPDDPRQVVLELAATSSSEPWVSYAPLAGRSFAEADWDAVVANVVRGRDSGLPFPTFGPLAATLR